MSTVLLFTDNTVLVNFAHLGRLDLLESLLRGRGRWCHAVSGECADSSQVEGLSSLTQVPEILGKPLMPTPAERVDSGVIWAAMAEPGADRAKNRGEAETIAIMRSRPDLCRSILVTDDSGAFRYARGLDPKVTCLTTWHLIREAQRADTAPARPRWALTPEEAWACIDLLRSRRRGIPEEIRTNAGWLAFVRGDGNLRRWPPGSGAEDR